MLLELYIYISVCKQMKCNLNHKQILLFHVRLFLRWLIEIYYLNRQIIDVIILFQNLFTAKYQ